MPHNYIKCSRYWMIYGIRDKWFSVYSLHCRLCRFSRGVFSILLSKWESRNNVVSDISRRQKIGDKNIDGIINQSLTGLSGLAGLSGSLELENSTTEKISALSHQFFRNISKFLSISLPSGSEYFYETLYENNFIIACNLFPTDSRQNHLENKSAEEIIAKTHRLISS